MPSLCSLQLLVFLKGRGFLTLVDPEQVEDMSVETKGSGLDFSKNLRAAKPTLQISTPWNPVGVWKGD